MPEFILNTEQAGVPWDSLDEFTQGFIEAAFFTSEAPGVYLDNWFTPENLEAEREGTNGGSIPADSDVAQIIRDSICAVKDFCKVKQKEMADLLQRAYSQSDYSEAQAGRDLWFTFNGHGVGYWSGRRALEIDVDGESLGDKLTAACGSGEIYLWIESPNKIHFEGV